MPRTSQSDLLSKRYELVEKVGEGGMAEVWRAIDHDRRPFSPDRQVALKILRPYLAEDPQAVKRFDREGKAMIGFDHPNIAKVFTRKRDGDVHFLVMEFIEGCTVSKLMKTRPRGMSPDDAVGIMSQVCEALEHAHSHGIIHRDIKPLNVMIEGEFKAGVTPTVKVTDFGIALAKRGTRLTRSDSVVGTVAYMPAEVVKGGEATEEADIYACGAMLYQMLTGRVPFSGETLSEILAEQEAGPPPVPTEGKRGVPLALSEATLVAIALHPKARFESARDMRGAIEAAISGEDLGGFLPTRVIQNAEATPRTLYRAAPARKPVPSIYSPEDPWAALLTYVAALSALLVLLEVTLRLTSAVAATPPWILGLAIAAGLLATALRRGPLFSADEARRTAARARFRSTVQRRFRTLLLLSLMVLWVLLAYYLVTVLKARIHRQPVPSHLWLEIGCAVAWLIALVPLIKLARSHKTVGRTAGAATLLVLLWVGGVLALVEAPSALGPFWPRPPLPHQVRAEGKQWVEMLQRSHTHIQPAELGSLRRELAKSRNSVLRALRHADTKPERRQAHRRARRWMRTMRRARRAWNRDGCASASSRLAIDRGGARAICVG
jgi:serine/threonine protein kinase